MALAPGTRLGAYEIVGLLGAGGMGEVNGAVDRRLDRPAAIKVLPDAFRSDPERTARFEREAKLLASLNHPNIAAIYGLEQGDGQQFIVMELVEGETLAERIARGRIPVPEVLEIAQQIAAALEAAHDKGVIHRDLKPANVKLTPDDQVKVLDFGLAKALDPAIGSATSSPWLSNSPTINSPAGATGLGVLLGTAAYMSPEQARGKTVDKRSDIWAFECVLFEMLTGKPAFDGEDVQSTLAAILRDTPDFSILPSETPPAVKTIVGRCLEKDPKRRIPEIAVVRFLLDDLATLTGRLSEPAVPGRWLRRPWVAAAATIVMGLAVLGTIAGLLLDSRAVSSRQTIRFEVAPPAPAVLAQLAVSPDGRSIAYTAMVGSRYVLFIRQLDTLVSRELPGTEAATWPFWSPDSRTVGFFAGGQLKKVDLARGQPQPLADVPRPLGATWSKDGFILFGAIGAGVQRVSQSGGVPVPVTVLTEGEGGHVDPTFLPDGRHFFYSAVNDVGSIGSLYVGSVDSREREQILDRTDASIVAYTAGHLLYAREGALVAQPFDVARLVLSGEAQTVVENIETFGSLNAAVFSVSETGILAYRTATDGNATLTWFDRQGRPLGSLGEPAAYADLELSPDEKRAAVSIFDPSQRTRDIWLVDFVRGMRTRFTFDPAENLNASWSPDGSRIVFNSLRGQSLDLYERPSDMSRPEELLFSDNREKYPFRWTPDGRFLSFISNSGTTQTGIWVLPIPEGLPSAAQERRPIVYLDTEFREEFPQLSSDGRWMAYKSNESKMNQVFVESFPERRAKVQVSIAGGSWPRWRDDNREIFFLSPDNMLMSAAVTTSDSAVEVGEVRSLFRAPRRQPGRTVTFAYDVAADGERFLFIAPSEESANSPITVAVDWLEELRNPRRN